MKHLLEQALNWEDTETGVLPPAKKCRTARQLRPAELDELVKGYQAGKTVFQLAAQFGIDRRTVGRHLRTRGIDTTPPGLRSNEIIEAAALYNSGWSLARIGDKYSATSTTVRDHLLKAGVVMRARRGGRRTRAASR